jgi:limonene-1,2-epoxide hydrolase
VRRAAIVGLSLTALAGCGGTRHTTTTTANTAPATTRVPDPALQLPAHVPRQASGPADPAAVRVIAAWLRALRSGDEARAARFWATGAKFQNATPVLVIRTPVEKLAIQRSLPCGARIHRAAGPAPFVVLVFVLTQRPGGNCAGGAGQLARGAIRVLNGRIVEWYRLPDQAPGPAT